MRDWISQSIFFPFYISLLILRFPQDFYKHNQNEGRLWFNNIGGMQNNMSIKINLDLVLLKKGISSKDLARTINITSANLSILKTGKARAIRFSTLNDICKALDCQPGDILEYIDDGLDDNIENDID